MNSCILMAKIISDPELRHVQQDGGEPIAVTSMLVEFENVQPEQPPSTLKVVGWRNLAAEMKKDYAIGDRVIVQGRLSMNVREVQGVKEKKAELVASRIYPIGDRSDVNYDYESIPNSTNNNVVEMDSYKSTNPRQSEAKTQEIDSFEGENNNSTEHNYDDIPFMRSNRSETSQLDLQDGWELAANQPGCWLRGTRDLWL
ncbi:MAG: single-stranded DNA-binding protein [Prochloraceae cyanobacterium]